MPFTIINAIQEAKELQEIFKDDIERKTKYKCYEKAHIEAECLQQEELILTYKK